MPTPPIRPSLLGTAVAVMLLAAPASIAGGAGQDGSCTGPACAVPTDPEVATLIEWVMAASDGAVIRLTPEGIAHGRSCDGARELVRMASDLYASLPESERLEPDLLWANPALTREVYAHAWASTLGSERGNPVNVVFADYIGDPSSFQSRVFRSPLLSVLCPG